MKKLVSLLLVLLLALPAFSLAEEAKELNLLNWETYIDDSVIAAFEQETGIKVNYAPMESNEDTLAKLSMSGGADYDLVLGSDYILSILRKEDLIQPLQMEKLPNFGNLDEAFLNQYYDPDNAYVIPYMAGCPLIVYDPAKVRLDITGYADLWDESLKDSVVIVDEPRVVTGITLKTMGKSFNETDPAVLEELKEKIMPLFQNIRAFDNNTPYTTLISGDASVGFMFTSQVNEVISARPDMKVVYPKEGLGFGIDGLVIPAKAEHVDNAHLFLDYLMRPEVAAHNAMQQGYMCVNKAAEPFLSDEFKANSVVYVPTELLAGAEFVEDVGELETTYLEIYNALKMQ